MTPGFWFTLGTVLAGATGSWYAVARARRQAEQTQRERERLEAEIEKSCQALEDDLQRKRFEFSLPGNVVDFWRGR